ncbi:MAG: DUF5017 domain-containing protein [Tidjanibacter sp.]|nr:DUF5017 domain-containing protein [Tidjanibacter sp.]
MKRKIYYIICAVVAMITMVSCDKLWVIETEDSLQITLLTNKVYTQEDVVFEFSGDADVVSFFSGEEGSSYEYFAKERTYEGDTYFTFSSAFQAGDQYLLQSEENVEKRPISIFYSTDFAGNYTHEGIATATWNELTDRFTYPTQKVSNAKDASMATSAGEYLLSDLLAEGDIEKPITFAVRYYMAPVAGAEAKERSRVSVHNFSLRNRCEEEGLESDYASQAELDFTLVTSGYNAADTTANYLPIKAAYLWFDCATSQPDEREVWAVSRTIKIDGTIHGGCDTPITIKAYDNMPPTKYIYSYSEVGDYNVCFMITNTSTDGTVRRRTEQFTVSVLDQGESTIIQPEQGQW